MQFLLGVLLFLRPIGRMEGSLGIVWPATAVYLRVVINQENLRLVLFDLRSA